MYDVDIKMEMFMKKERWERGIQHCIDKGIRPEELQAYTTPESRVRIAQVLLSGEYRIAPPRVALIPKDDGEFRKVYVNTTVDRLVLTIMNDVYSELYYDKMHEKCVSYKKGLGVHNIIRQVTKELTSNENVKGYKVDISKYFDKVNKETMDKVLNELDTGSCLDETIRSYYHDDIIMNESGEIEEHYKSLAQGCALGALLANLVLYDVDENLSAMCSIYYRYSDDILIIGSNADKALQLLECMLKEKGLELNPKKIEPLSSDKWFTFLGCKVKGEKVSLSKKSLVNFQEIMKTKTIKKLGKERKKSVTQAELRKAIKSINMYLYKAHIKNSSVFGWAEYFFKIINCEQDIIALDEWIKDLLRAYYTGKIRIGGLGSVERKDFTVSRGKGRNVSANLLKTKGFLEKCGYVSMHHLYKVYRINKEVYLAEVNKLI